MKRIVTSALVLALLVLFTVPAVAQGGSAESSVKGNMSGIVVDSTGAVIPGAKVTLSGAFGSQTDTTNADGGFLFPLLTPGTYAVKVEKGQFKTAEAKGIEILTGKTSSLRISMQPGEATTIVEVTGSALTVDTGSTAVSTNLNDTFYQAVPVARGVAGLFYASPSAVDGGIAGGTANPSIGGSSSLENLYVADGVSITDGAFGGIGTFSRVYGSLSTGINLSFVKEVQVKTGGFEAQYGKADGGIVQIVTKSGSSKFHGSIGGFFAPEEFEAERQHPDNFFRFNKIGELVHQANYDLDIEAGGYVPHYKDHLFFFGSFNPSWNANHDQYAQFANPTDCGTACAGATNATSLGNVDLTNHVYNFAGKLTWKLNDNHTFESSIFGDPTYGNSAPNFSLVTSATSTNDKLDYGTRNFVVRYNGVLTPSWLLNGSFAWGHNHLTDVAGDQNTYFVSDTIQSLPCIVQNATAGKVPCVSDTYELRGNFNRQGYGFAENTTGDTYGFSVDTTKNYHFLGSHSTTFGYRLDRSFYDGTRTRTGPRYTIPTCNFDSSKCNNALYGNNDISGGTSNATFSLLAAPLGGPCDPAVVTGGVNGRCPLLFVPGLTAGVPVYLRQTRGEFGSPQFNTDSWYHALFAQDTWTINKFVSVTAGLRWEQEEINGNAAHYTFTDNWSPRVGVSIDPWGNRKTKVYANFARYTQPLPLDVGIRSLSQEEDLTSMRFAPGDDGTGNVVVNPDGSFNIITDAAHLLNKSPNGIGGTPSQSGQDLTAFFPGTRLQYTDEYVVGFEHEFGNSGVIFSARYQDRRLKRVIEDMAEVTPECGQAGCSAQQNYVIANPSSTLDIFTNYNQIDFLSSGAVPGACNPADTFVGPGAVVDANGNGVSTAAGNDSFCLTNSATAGALAPDGIADGFVQPTRVYKAMEFEVNKSYSKGWQLRANYRIAKLFGNFEGLARNDNGQTDPGISSLFDFTQGDFNLLGGQFIPGVLNTDVRHNVNGFFAYTFSNKWMKGLTMGTSVHFQTGTPITPLLAHPVYLNGGENPDGARGSGGRTPNFGQVDFHADYPIRLTENTKIRLGADLFNVTNQRTQLRVDQNEQVQFLVPNLDFKKPIGDGTQGSPGFQRPFYARFMVKFEF
jgi:carboxypeptidase family protein/TonB-dependent receptor-like protein